MAKDEAYIGYIKGRDLSNVVRLDDYRKKVH